MRDPSFSHLVPSAHLRLQIQWPQRVRGMAWCLLPCLSHAGTSARELVVQVCKDPPGETTRPREGTHGERAAATLPGSVIPGGRGGLRCRGPLAPSDSRRVVRSMETQAF